MKRMTVLAVAAALGLSMLAGCSQESSSDASHPPGTVEVVEGGEGTSPETALPFGGTYLFEDGIRLTVSEPEDITLSGFTADEYDLSLGTPIGFQVTFVNTSAKEMNSGGVFVEMESEGQVAQLVLNPEAQRVFHSGVFGAYTEEQLLEIPPVVLKPNKEYTFDIGFIVADPSDMLLTMSDLAEHTIYFTTE